MKRILLALALCLAVSPVWAAAVQVDFLLSTFLDNDQAPLAAGLVYAYTAGTTTPKDLYLDSAKASTAAWPLVLTAYGRSPVFADGNYKFVIKTSAGVTIATYDNLEFVSAVNPTTAVITNLTVSSATISLLYINDGHLASTTISGGLISNSNLGGCHLLASPVLDSDLVDFGTLKAMIASH